MYIIHFFSSPNPKDSCNYYECVNEKDPRTPSTAKYIWTSNIERAFVFDTIENAEVMVKKLKRYYVMENADHYADGIHAVDVTDQRGNIAGKRFGI